MFSIKMDVMDVHLEETNSPSFLLVTKALKVGGALI